MKLQKPFSFTYSLTKKRVIDCRMQTVTVAELTVEGTGYMDPTVSPFDMDYNRFDVDIDFVRHNGHDIRDVIETTDKWADIEEEAIIHVSGIFETKNMEVA